MTVENIRFYKCRERLWKLLSEVDFSEGCKSYEGEITISVCYPRFFDSERTLPKPESFSIHLDCYVLGPHRHYDFRGKTFGKAIDAFEKWLDAREREMLEAEDDG